MRRLWLWVQHKRAGGTWRPIPLERLQEHIAEAEPQMGESGQAFWDLIKLRRPEKWKQNPWGDLGGGFWAVAVFGNTCVYYNDIEEGFNISSFTRWGKIDQYWCNQDELQWVITRLLNQGVGYSKAGPPEPFDY